VVRSRSFAPPLGGQGEPPPTPKGGKSATSRAKSNSAPTSQNQAAAKIAAPLQAARLVRPHFVPRSGRSNLAACIATAEKAAAFFWGWLCTVARSAQLLWSVADSIQSGKKHTYPPTPKGEPLGVSFPASAHSHQTPQAGNTAGKRLFVSRNCHIKH
jgi:hypothetical protein